MLKKYTRDSSHMLPYAEIPLQATVTYEERPAEILAQKIYMSHNKETPMVKVHWKKHSVEEATWELELDMYEKYPHLF